MTTNYSFVVYGLTLWVALSCTQQSQKSIEDATNRIIITDNQFELNAMHLGEPTLVGFDSIVSCSGKILPMADGRIALTVPVSGVVQSIKVQSGRNVNKGQVLFEIGGNEILDLQRDFLQASATYNRMLNEYNRSEHLFENSVIPEKEYQQVKSEYLLARSAYDILKMKIEGAGLSPSDINAGQLSNVYPVRAPINGNLGQLMVTAGAYVDANSTLAEVTDPDRLQLQLSIFDTDARKIKKGQLVRFYSTDAQQSASTTITSIGSELIGPARVLLCNAHLSGELSRRYKVNQILVSEVVVSTDSVKAIPVEALVKSESGIFVLLLIGKKDNRYEFEITDVEVGRQHNGMIELTGDIPEGILATKGVYNLVL